MSTNYLKYNEALTEKCKYIFGDCVVGAYVGMEYFNFLESKLAFTKKLEYEANNSTTGDDGVIDLTATSDLYVEFTNGNVVQFWVSEWGGIGIVHDTEYIKLLGDTK